MASDLEQAGSWLARHGLASASPTPLLAVRLAARRRARLASSVLLGTFILAIALISTTGAGPLLLTATVIALVAALALLDGWVRRVDRRAGATLLRRAAHPVQLGWRTVLGLPRAVFAVATFTAAAVLAASGLTVDDPDGRDAAVVLLIGWCGVAIGMCVQLRHLLTHPAVADDEVPLTADAVMRVEDAREVAAPTALWSLPVVSLLNNTPGWWTVAWLTFVVLGALTLILINLRTAASGTVARHAMSGGR
ncbi:hypothetical protein [Dactylosporangium sp. NPDC005555]|uniref:hypothetical protein n=1 Tax=Dactylosporangium sp. NPDC005555 TaxID=3154889 RepID=UPI0033A76E5D